VLLLLLVVVVLLLLLLLLLRLLVTASALHQHGPSAGAVVPTQHKTQVVQMISH